MAINVSNIIREAHESLDAMALPKALVKLSKEELIDPIDLDLSKSSLQYHQLQLIKDVIPSLRSLDISRSWVNKLPEVWVGDCLQVLKMAKTTITRLSMRNCMSFRYLRIFIAAESTSLTCIQALNNARVLEEIDISYTEVTKAPIGCISLKVFRATYAQKLSNIIGLDDSDRLEQVYIQGTRVARFPKQYPHLKDFDATCTPLAKREGNKARPIIEGCPFLNAEELITLWLSLEQRGITV